MTDRRPLMRHAAVTVTALLMLAPTSAIAEPAGGPSAGVDSGARRIVEGSTVGDWAVRGSGHNGFTVSWTSPTRLPVSSDRPRIVQGSTDLGPTTTSSDRRTVRVHVFSRTAPDPDALDVRLSGHLLDEATEADSLPQRVTPGRAPALGRLLDVDPGRRGDLKIMSSNYTRRSLRVPGLKKPLEVVGHVVAPVGRTGPAPLVLFLHGRHDYCYSPSNPDRFSVGFPCDKGTRPVPSQLGYDYIQRVLASEGYLTVSIAANSINAQDDQQLDGGAAARARLVRHHLDLWASWAATGRYDVDMDNVVLVGHSRGGEGVNRASEEIPIGAPYRIAGQVLLAPTNFARQTAPYIPTVTVLPYCDGDVSDLQGQTYTDTARDLTRDDTAVHSTVLVMGANHNFFNTEWTPGRSVAPASDDWADRSGFCGKAKSTRLSAAQQRHVGTAYVAGAVAWMTGTDFRPVAMYDGSRARVASIGHADVRTHMVGGGRMMLEPGRDIRTSVAIGGKAQLCRGLWGQGTPDLCGRFAHDLSAPHWPVARSGIPSARAVEVSWRRSGATVDLPLARPVDLSADQSLDLRTIVDPRRGGVRFTVVLVDVDGRSAGYAPGLVPALPKVDQLGGRYLAQNVRVPLSGLDRSALDRRGLDSSAVDLTRIVAVRIVAEPSASISGRIWILDMAGVPTTTSSGATLPGVPRKRLPLINLRSTGRVEGNAAGTAYLSVPYTVRGTLAAPARFVVTTADFFNERSGPRFVVNLAAGATSGTVQVPYQPNRIDDLAQRRMLLNAYAVNGVMAHRSVARAVIVDDDPTPRITMAPMRSNIRECQSAVWRVRLARPVGYGIYLQAWFTPGPGGPTLTLADLSPAWVARTLGYDEEPKDTPLVGQRFYLTAEIAAGHHSAVFAVPTVCDGVREPTERVTLKVRSYPGLVRGERTIRVHDR